MKTKDINGLSDKELGEKISEETLSLTKLRLGHSISPLENPMRIQKTRKLIAMLKTEKRKRTLTSQFNKL